MKHKKKKARDCRYTQGLSQQSKATLAATAKKLTQPGKGLLDLSNDGKHFNELFCDESEDDSRHKYLSLYLEAAKFFRFYVQGLLLTGDMLDFDKARRTMLNFKEFGISLGVKLEAPSAQVEGTAGEVCSDGLDTMADTYSRLTEVGVEFVMWSVDFQVTATQPSQQMLLMNCLHLARFAMICQNQNLVPILSVVVIEDRDLDIEMAQEKLRDILAALVKAMSDLHVYKEGVILAVQALAARSRRARLLGVMGRPIPVTEHGDKDPTVTVEHRRAVATSLAVSRSVPGTVAGIVLTNLSSSGMSEYNKILNALNKCPIPRFPFHVGFCFQQTKQEDFLSTWAGQDKNLNRACDLLVKNVKACSDATMGQLCSQHKSVFITNITPM